MRVLNAKLNIIFAIILASIPMIVSLVDLIGIDITLPYYIVIWGIGYCVFLILAILKYCLKGNKINLKFVKNPLFIIASMMMVWILISSIINNAFNIYFIIYLTYFLIFICVYVLDAKWKNRVLNLLLVVVAVSCVMGFIDPYAKFMPGFNRQHLTMSLHFVNPNYAGYIVSALALVCFVNFNRANSFRGNMFYGVTYLIFAVHLFINGSFTPITALILVEVVVQIVVGIKSKKFNYKMFILIIILFPICLLVDLIPNIVSIRNCEYNYLLECVAVFDNIFNTNLLNRVGIDCIAGADGWDRDILIKQSWQQIISSPKAFIFGGGSGMFYDFKPHNGLLSLMLDFGLLMPLLFVTFLIVIALKMVKNKISLSKAVFVPSIMAFLICYMMGSIVPNSFYIFVIILSLMYSQAFNNEKV